MKVAFDTLLWILTHWKRYSIFVAHYMSKKANATEETDQWALSDSLLRLTFIFRSSEELKAKINRIKESRQLSPLNAATSFSSIAQFWRNHDNKSCAQRQSVILRRHMHKYCAQTSYQLRSTYLYSLPCIRLKANSIGRVRKCLYKKQLNNNYYARAIHEDEMQLQKYLEQNTTPFGNENGQNSR